MNLIIITTPLQCWIANEVIKSMGINEYHVVYLTRNNSAEDLHYFNEISRGASLSRYIFKPIGRPDIMNQLLMLFEARSVIRGIGQYKCILLASIDALIPSYIVEKFNGKIITFDDGSANINKKSSYWIEPTGVRYALYKKILGCSTLEKTKNKIDKHFTLYENAENIVEPNRLVILKRVFGGVVERKIHNETLVIFVGQPFNEDLTPVEIGKIKEHILKLGIDYYIKHPREVGKIIEGVPELSKNGCIAEDVILDLSEKYNITLIGWFSSVMLNLNVTNIKKIMLLFSHDAKVDEFHRLAVNANCEVKFL